jgi:hypothetical protein
VSAALQLPLVWGASSLSEGWPVQRRAKDQRPAAKIAEGTAQKASVAKPDASLGFYRKHTEAMLRRYLYASMQVGRSPSILGDPIGRGWVSSRPVRTFEDAVIFVLDIEKCLDKLGWLDRQLLSRIVLQEFTHVETASLMGMSVRAVAYKFPLALDRLTEMLLESDLLILPNS